MISRQNVFDIHRLKDEGYSTRKIARLLGIGRNTVTRYLEDPEKVFGTRKKRDSKLDGYKAFIDGCLEKDPTVCAPVVLQKIQTQGYPGGVTILREYLKETRGRVKVNQAFIRFEAEPGQEIQIDWGHFGGIVYGNTRRKLYALVAVESYSRMLYVEFTHSRKQEVLHSCLLNAFKYFEGTPKSVLVDNMVTAVVDREGRLIRFNDAFLNFPRPFHIVPKACNIRSPNEKGKVENGIKYLRGNFMPLRDFNDLTDIQTQVLDWLDQVANMRIHQTTGECPKERFKTAGLKPMPPQVFEPMETSSPLVHKDFAVKFDGNSYTAPPWTIGRKLTLKADQHMIWIHHKEKLICSHPRCWERKKRIENPTHAEQVKKLRRRQWESKEIASFASLGEEFREYLEALPNSNLPLKKQVSNLLSLKDQYGVKSLSWAVQKALRFKAYGADYIENILNQEMTPVSTHAPVKLKNEALNKIRLSEPSLNDYDALVLKRRKHS
ncbi:MAG: IS21 family transposase [Proteobacteria bacterium]|nr:IS21 family transposase [Pseudomonadota bacterium]